jgi:hypothetical protein
MFWRSTRFGELRSLAVAVTLSVLAGCGGGDDGGTNPPPPPTDGFTISASSTTSSVTRGGISTVTVTVTRSGSFTGPVSLQPTGMPSGVTALFSSPSVPSGQNTSTLTFTAGASATLGTATITVVGNGSGVANQSLTIQLTVNAAPAQTGPFTLSISATSFLSIPNNLLSTPPIITITRNPGFTGSVAFSVTGLPSTIAIGFTPSTTTGNTTTAIPLNIGGTPNGTYTAQIRGASTQGDQTITLQVVVAPPSTGSIRWKWCSGSLPRYFVAVRDGTGPWTRVAPSGTDSSYSFNIASATGQVAEVTNEGGGFRTTIYAYTAQQLAARAASQCTLVQNVSSRTANGSFGGVTGFRVSLVGMGWWFGSANGNGSFSLLNLPTGPLDVMAVRNGDFTDPAAIPVDRMIIRRGINPASGAAIPVLDFNAAESFAPNAASWIIGNNTGEPFSVSQTFHTAGGTTGMFTVIPGVDGAATTRVVYGVPQAQTIAGDLHQVVATIATTGPTPTSPLRATRQVIKYSRTIAPGQLNFGSAMPSPVVSPVAGAPAGRLRFQGSLPDEYNTGVSIDITQTGSNNFLTIHTTRGFLGAGNTYDVTTPDLTGAIGWDTQFAIRAGVPVQWWANGGGPVLDYFDVRYIFNSTRSRWTGALTGITAPADGATYVMARTTGTATP